MVKYLIGLLFLSIISGCLPNDGGFYPNPDQGAIAPDQRFPEDYTTLQTYFSQFEVKTPTSDYSTMNGYFAVPTDIVTESTASDAATSTNFLQSGLYQSTMFSNSTYGLAGKTVDFDTSSLAIKNFYYFSQTPPYVEMNPAPTDEIPIGTIVLVGINATIDGEPSDYFQNTYMVKIKQGASYWYVWYGNQSYSLPP